MLAKLNSNPDCEASYSIADAIEIVTTWSDLRATRQRDLASALNRAAMAARVPPGAVKLTPAAIRSSLLCQPAAALGVTEGTMRNIRSALKAVASRLGIIDPGDMQASARWLALLELIAPKKRCGLIRFAGFCSVRGVEPDAVSDGTIEQFQVWLTDRTFTPLPAKQAGNVRGAWNLAVRSVVGWPQRPLSNLRTKGQYILPLSAFPASFQTSLDAFAAELAPTSLARIFGDDDTVGKDRGNLIPPPRACRPSTIQTRLGHCRWAASAVVATGVPIQEITSLACLVTPVERVKHALMFLYERAGQKPSAGAGHVAEVLRIIAKHHGGSPATDLAQIKKWASVVTLKYHCMTEKNMLHIRQMLEPQREARLHALPQMLMNQARILRVTAPRQAASIAMRAVAIELLTNIPLRLANVTGLRLDQHLCRADPMRGRITHVRVQPAEAKGKRLIEMPIPSQLSNTLQEWIDDFRPLLGSSECRYLFPFKGKGDRSITSQGLRVAIRDTMEKYVGVPLTPHQFRHLAAALYLRDHPGAYETVRLLLSHADLKSVIRSYAGIEKEAAIVSFHELIEQRRRTLRPSAKGKRP
jgi:integrase